MTFVLEDLSFKTVRVEVYTNSSSRRALFTKTFMLKLYSHKMKIASVVRISFWLAGSCENKRSYERETRTGHREWSL